jgi:hypothetical protein
MNGEMDARLYRTELSRNVDGYWCLFRDCKPLGRTEGRRFTIAAAQEWAAGILGEPVTWFNGMDLPEGESGYWVADPQEDDAPGTGMARFDALNCLATATLLAGAGDRAGARTALDEVTLAEPEAFAPGSPGAAALAVLIDVIGEDMAVAS